MTAVTPGIRQDWPPADWARHRFGLPEARWQALAGRTVWITGAGTGYGQALATTLGAAGASVVLTGRRDAMLRGTVTVAEALGSLTDRFLVVPADITDPAQVDAAAAAIRAAGLAPDGLVNNAALPQRPAGRFPLGDMDEAQWAEQIAVNLTAQWRVARAALGLAGEAGPVRMIFVTSEAGWAFTPGHGSYNVSKAALNALAGSFAEELAARFPGRDVQVNTLIPGEALTEMNRGSPHSPYAVVPMALLLLSHPAGGPNGRYFHRDGRHFPFNYAAPHPRPLV